ncbi:hypothetical protein TNCV_1860161 [Trichonephila clavipes]|nr:hypothetical protein TNCV_1860161 [Trichonephila clavipes]
MLRNWQATRKRRKEEQVQQSGTRYNSPRTLGKAGAKIKRYLPASPTKAVEVVKKIAAEFQIAVFDKNDAPKAVPRKLMDESKKNRFMIFIIGMPLADKYMA